MTPSFLGFPVVLILLALLILIRGKRGKPLDKEDRRISYAILALAIISVLFQVFSWVDLTPASFSPYAHTIEYVAAILVVILVILLIIRNRKQIMKSFAKKYAPVEYSINKHHRKRLLKEIGLELKKEVTTQNIIFSDQDKEEGLQTLITRVCNDIMNGTRAYPTYGVYPTHEPNVWKICGIGIKSQDSANILAKKMTDLYQNQKYGKRLYRYFGLFI